jgi:hypothetical protein
VIRNLIYGCEESSLVLSFCLIRFRSYSLGAALASRMLGKSGEKCFSDEIQVNFREKPLNPSRTVAMVTLFQFFLSWPTGSGLRDSFLSCEISHVCSLYFVTERDNYCFSWNICGNFDRMSHLSTRRLSSAGMSISGPVDAQAKHARRVPVRRRQALGRAVRFTDIAIHYDLTMDGNLSAVTH